MCFNLKDDVVLLIKFDDARVVHKHGDAPTLVNFFGCALDSCFEQPINYFRVLPLFGILNYALEGFVDTVFRPRLSDCLKLNIGWGSSNFCEIGLNRPHLGEIERE